MKFIFQKTVVAYEWMPDGPVKDLIDRFAHDHEYSEGQHFDFAGMLEYFQDEDKEAFDTLEVFMDNHNLTGFAEVFWSW